MQTGGVSGKIRRSGIGSVAAMQLKFLGSGSAFTVGQDNFQSNVLVEFEGRRLLLDCGGDIRHSLAAQNLSYVDVDEVYVSHLHADHIGGLEYLGFSTKFDPRCVRPRLHIADDLAEPLWNQSLAGGMSDVDDGSATLDTFFDVNPVPSGGSFTWQDITFQLVPVPHVTTTRGTLFSYGLFFDAHGVKIFFTTDTQFAPGALKKYFNDADVIFHDAETSVVKSGVHAHYDQLRKLPAKIKRKTWLYHFNAGPLPDAHADGFLGFVRRGQSFDLAEPLAPTSRPFKRVGTL